MFRIMPRMGKTENLDKLRKKVDDYFIGEPLTYQKVAEIFFTLEGKKVKGEKAYEQAFRKGYFSGLVGEQISKEKVITNEVAWQLLCDYLK